jgi:uncharacterized protein YukE
VKTVPGDSLEIAILDYLYKTFLDEPAFNKAVQAAMPSTDHVKGLQQERDQAANQLKNNQRQIDRLVDAIANGADVGILLDKQEKLKREREALTHRLEEMDKNIATLPTLEETKQAAMTIRLRLRFKHTGKDWRTLPFEEVRQFLFHLFGDSTLKSKTGIFVEKDDKGNLVVVFRGLIDFHDVIVNNRPTSEVYLRYADWMNAELMRTYRERLTEADAKYQAQLAELNGDNKPYMAKLSAR